MRNLVPTLALLLVIASIVSRGEEAPKHPLLGRWTVLRTDRPFVSALGSSPYQLTGYDFRESILYQETTTGRTPVTYRIGEEHGRNTIDLVYTTANATYVAQGIFRIQGNLLYVGWGRTGFRPHDFKFGWDEVVYQLTFFREGTKIDIPGSTYSPVPY